jgi:hypothetical protein
MMPKLGLTIVHRPPSLCMTLYIAILVFLIFGLSRAQNISLAEVAENGMVVNEYEPAFARKGAVFWYMDFPVDMEKLKGTSPRPVSSLLSCGKNHVTCEKVNQGAIVNCLALVDTLRLVGGEDVPRLSRAACYGYGTDRCCIVWPMTVRQLTKGNLLISARKILSECRTAEQWSVGGYSQDTLLAESECTRQCLTNRPYVSISY